LTRLTRPEAVVPAIATGVQYREALLRAAHAVADAAGVRSTATVVTPALVALSEADLLRLAATGGRRDVYYDGRVVWIDGIDFRVQR
jgi:hypothetical protein